MIGTLHVRLCLQSLSASHGGFLAKITNKDKRTSQVLDSWQEVVTLIGVPLITNKI